jgi:hypothetical protein
MVNDPSADPLALVRRMPSHWRPFLREADIARMAIADGLASLRKANHMEHGYYNRAFFGLSIGLERLLKLVILIDYGLTHDGEYPTNRLFKTAYGHDLVKLFAAAEKVRVRLSNENRAFQWSLPDPDLARRIFAVLSEFGRQSRYYNLDLLTGLESGRDPIAAWAEDGGDLIAERYPPRRRRRDEAEAAAIGELLSGRASVLAETEDGRPIYSVAEAARHARRGEFIQGEATFQAAAIVRYLAEILRELCELGGAGTVVEVPHLWEFFSVFNNEDRDLRRWKTFL